MNIIQYTISFSKINILHGSEAKECIKEIKSNITDLSRIKREELNSRIDENEKSGTKLKPFKIEGIKLINRGSIFDKKKSNKFKNK